MKQVYSTKSNATRTKWRWKWSCPKPSPTSTWKAWKNTAKISVRQTDSYRRLDNSLYLRHVLFFLFFFLCSSPTPLATQVANRWWRVTRLLSGCLSPSSTVAEWPKSSTIRTLVLVLSFLSYVVLLDRLFIIIYALATMVFVPARSTGCAGAFSLAQSNLFVTSISLGVCFISDKRAIGSTTTGSWSRARLTTRNLFSSNADGCRIIRNNNSRVFCEANVPTSSRPTSKKTSKKLKITSSIHFVHFIF